MEDTSLNQQELLRILTNNNEHLRMQNNTKANNKSNNKSISNRSTKKKFKCNEFPTHDHDPKDGNNTDYPLIATNNDNNSQSSSEPIIMKCNDGDKVIKKHHTTSSF